MIEIALLQHLQKGIADGSLPKPNAEQQSCLDSFLSNERIITPLNFTFWSGVGYYAVDPVNVRKVPLHLKLFSMVAVAAGGYGSQVLLTRRVHRSCVQCIVDSRDKTSAFYKTTRALLEQYHPGARAEYFKREKYRLEREGVANADEK